MSRAVIACNRITKNDEWGIFRENMTAMLTGSLNGAFSIAPEEISFVTTAEGIEMIDVENTAGAIDHGIVDRTTIEQNSIFGRSCKADVFVKHNCYGVVAGIDLTASGERVARCGQSISLVADDAQKCGCWRIYDSILCVGVHAGCPSEEDSRCTDDGENLDVFHNIHNLYDIIRQ